MDNQDKQVMRKILEVLDESKLIPLTRDEFFKGVVFKNATAMILVRIGELAKHFSNEFQNKHEELQIHKIRGLRNIVAHRYDQLDFEIVWKTFNKDIPILKSQIEKLLK